MPPPDFGAVGQYALLAARQEAARGRDVTLLGLASASASIEEEAIGTGRLRVARLAAAACDRASLWSGLGWTLAVNVRRLCRARRCARTADEVLITGSLPFFLCFIVPADFVLRQPLTYRITDPHPECLIAELGREPW